MNDTVRVEIDPAVEAYPMLAIREDASAPTTFEIPAAMLARLRDAEALVERAELDIMRYVAERYDAPTVREWLAEREEP